MNREDHMPATEPVSGDHGEITRHPVTCVSHGFQTNYERGFCNGLAVRGVEVTLIGSDRTDSVGLSAAVSMLNLRGSQEEDRPAWQKAANIVRYHYRLLLHVLRRRSSIVHVIGLIDSPLLVGVFEGAWFRLLSHRYVMTVHNLLPHEDYTRWRQLTFRCSYALPQKLVVHTQRMKAELCDTFGVEPGRVTVMEHGIEPIEGVRDLSRPLPTESETPTILLFGKVAPYKGADLLLGALRDVSFPYRLVIAGACPRADYRADLRAAIASHPHRQHIDWQDGFVSEAQMERLFLSASLVALPYRHIDQSGVLFQALRYGVPVLATKVGQFEDYVTPTVGEIATPNSAASLTTALNRWAVRRGTFSRDRIREIGRSYLWSTTILRLRHAYH